MKIAGKNSGQMIIFVVLVIPVLLGVGALMVDVAKLYETRSKLTSAADSAALSAAYQIPDTYAAYNKAVEYATYNGFNPSQSGVIVSGQLNPDGNHSNWYKVTIYTSVPMSFAGIFGISTVTVSATATAEFISYQPINIYGGGSYGLPDMQCLEISGPKSYYSYGDPYSTMYLNDGSNNPLYDAGGYNYSLNVPSNYSTINGTNTVKLEIYDPAIYTGTGSIDEKYSSHGSSYSSNKTKYSIYAPDSTPTNYDDDVLIATQTFNATGSSSYKKKWIDTFTINSSTYGTGDYRICVQGVSGGGGNAFHLRAGPPRASGVPFNSSNGTSIESDAHLQMFFVSGGSANFVLGTIPAEAAGAVAHIRNFDTDIGSVSVHYHDTTGMLDWYGTLSTNSTWVEETFTIPEGYPGGTLTATYTAGATDTSVWEMWYEGEVPGVKAAQVRLVQ